MSAHEEEALGKAYDSRLMRRLLGYLRPYWRSVMLALVAIISGSLLQLAQPYLTKIAIDEYIANADLAGLNWVALLFLLVLVSSFALEFAQTWLMQMTGQRIMFDMRMQIYTHLQRLSLRDYDRNPVGRLMTRVTTDVDTLNELFSSGVVAIFGDVFTLAGIMVVLVWLDWRLAIVAFSVLPADRAGDAVVPAGTCASPTGRCACGSRASTRSCRRTSPGMATVQLFRREAEELRRLRRDQPDASRRQHRVDLLLRRLLPGHRGRLGAGGGADRLVRRWVGDAGHAHARRAGGVPAVFAAVLPARSPTCRRSSTSCSRRWPRRSGSSSCWTRRSWSRRLRHRRRLPRGASGHIVFDHVWFAYEGDDYVLRDVSLRGRRRAARRHRRGHRGGEVDHHQPAAPLLRREPRGASWSTAWTSASCAFEDLRRLFGLVLAGRAPVLRHHRGEHPARDTRRSPTSESCSAAKAVHAHPFVSRLPQGYDAPVAERGAPRCRWDRSSCCRSRGRSPSIRAC